MDNYEKWGNSIVRPIAGFPNLTPNRIPTLFNESRPASDFPHEDNSGGDDGSGGDGGGGNGPGAEGPVAEGGAPVVQGKGLGMRVAPYMLGLPSLWTAVVTEPLAVNDEPSGDGGSDSDRASNPGNSSGVLYSEVSDPEDRRSESWDDQGELGDPGSYEITEEQEQNMMANTNCSEPPALFDPDEKPTHLPELSPNKRRRLGPKFRPHNMYAPFQFLAGPS
ncbi:hypothetical protein DL764_005470 [Monosporascus ibericus]|uniref:Uncharacterized protein n=1 Tax=Monosporascus ibericus TaxID=155417 RepID=A0A4Q4TBQ7_9PEZI|nr:hypothetical protein DL764_005470 [Monosporascus ibericus]